MTIQYDHLFVLQRLLREWTHRLAELAEKLNGELTQCHVLENPKNLLSAVLQIMEILEEIIIAEGGYEADESGQSVDGGLAEFGTAVKKLHSRLHTVPKFRRKFNGYPWQCFIPPSDPTVSYPTSYCSDSECDESMDSMVSDVVKNKPRLPKRKTFAMKKIEDKLLTCTSSDSDHLVNLSTKNFEFLGDIDLKTADLSSVSDLKTAYLSLVSDLKTAYLSSVSDLKTAYLSSVSDLKTAYLSSVYY